MTVKLSPDAAVADLAERLAAYRFVKLAAWKLRERLEQRQQVWSAGSGVLRERASQMSVREVKPAHPPANPSNRGC